MISIVIPTLNDSSDLFTLLNSNIMFNIDTGLIDREMQFVVVDDTKDDSVEEVCNSFNDYAKIFYPLIYVKYLRGCNNYGDSLIKGMMRTGKTDVVIIMDADHPVSYLPCILTMLSKYDVVIGIEKESNKERKVTKWLLNTFLGLNYEHPTCGYMGFNNYVLGHKINERMISFWRAKSKHDYVHVEFLLMAHRNKRIEIGEFKFGEHKGGTEYSTKRKLVWLKDFLRSFFSHEKNDKLVMKRTLEAIS